MAVVHGVDVDSSLLVPLFGRNPRIVGSHRFSPARLSLLTQHFRFLHALHALHAFHALHTGSSAFASSPCACSPWGQTHSASPQRGPPHRTLVASCPRQCCILGTPANQNTTPSASGASRPSPDGFPSQQPSPASAHCVPQIPPPPVFREFGLSATAPD